QHLQGRDRIDETTIIPFHLKPTITCIYCEAKKFVSEPNCFCCNDGKVKLVNTETHTTLKNLFTRTDEIAYNNLFAFTSMGVHLDQHFANGKTGIYTFCAQGNMYYAIGSFLPPAEDSPKYLQLYIYDTEHKINNRLQIMPNLRKDTIELIKNILDEVNPYVANFQSAHRRGLLDSDKSLYDCMFEAKQFRSPYALHNLFSTILVFGEPINVRKIWNQNINAMSEDFIKKNIPEGQQYIDAVLKHIDHFLQQHDKNISDYDLPKITNIINKDLPKIILEELSIPVLSNDIKKLKH
ncbi:28086_t:CDS:2, partial [Gigaspora margarita]